jgi:hypothetical protein
MKPKVHKPYGWCQPAPKKVDAFYLSPAWKRARKEVLDACGHRCQWTGCDRDAVIVDHKLAIKQGGAPLDRSNLWGLCRFHSGTKTAKSDLARDERGCFAGSQTWRTVGQRGAITGVTVR